MQCGHQDFRLHRLLADVFFLKGTGRLRHHHSSETIWTKCLEPAVQGKPSLWRMKTPSPGSRTDLAEIQSSCCRSLRIASKRTVPYVLLAGKRRCSAQNKALAHPWPCVLLYAFPPLSLISATQARVRACP